MYIGWSEGTMLPSRYVDDVKNDPDESFLVAMKKVGWKTLHNKYQTFDDPRRSQTAIYAASMILSSRVVGLNVPLSHLKISLVYTAADV